MDETAVLLADLIMSRNALIEDHGLLHPSVKAYNARIRALMDTAVRAYGSEVKRRVHRIIDQRMLMMFHP